jgi:hypothetical protein
MTTTGSKVLVGIEFLSDGLKLWRGIMQWLGGIGIIAKATLGVYCGWAACSCYPVACLSCCISVSCEGHDSRCGVSSRFRDC